MAIQVNALVLILGLVLLLKGSEFFVKSASSIAKKLGVSEFIIGLTLVAIGTSVPELASSVAASMQHQSGIVIGNVVGSNIANIGLIIGIASIITLMKTNEEMLKRDGYIMLFAAVLFYIFIFDGNISVIEAIIFLLLYLAYVMFLFEEKPKFKAKYHFKEFIRYFFGFEYLMRIGTRIRSNLKGRKRGEITTEEIKILSKEGLVKDFMIMTVGGFAVVFGAKYLVEEAIFFADFFNIPKTLIGISIIAVGTSLPELIVSISAVRAGYGNIAVGNIIGSNIANIFLVLGVSAAISPLSITGLTIFYTGPFMILMSILLLIFIKSHWEIRRIEGIIFLILYAAFMTFLLLNSLNP